MQVKEVQGLNYGRAHFGGTNDFAYITDASMSDLDIGASNFCIQYWVYPVDLMALNTYNERYINRISALLLLIIYGCMLDTLCIYYNWGDPKKRMAQHSFCMYTW